MIHSDSTLGLLAHLVLTSQVGVTACDGHLSLSLSLSLSLHASWCYINEISKKEIYVKSWRQKHVAAIPISLASKQELSQASWCYINEISKNVRNLSKKLASEARGGHHILKNVSKLRTRWRYSM